MATLASTTTYMTFQHENHASKSSTSSASSTCTDTDCRAPGNDACRNVECVAVNDLLYKDDACAIHAYLGKRLSLERKKRLSFGLCFFTAFLTGTEYAVILPTVWQYLQELGQYNERYVGYVTAAFSFGSIMSYLVVGRITDKSRDSRRIILLVNGFQVMGQLLYALGISAGFLVFARFLSGIGAGMNAALFAEVVRGTSRGERPWYIVGSFMTRQFGIFLAPAYNAALRHLPEVEWYFRDGYVWRLHEGSYPGLLMAALWLVFELCVAVFYFNMTAERKAERHRRRQQQTLWNIKRAQMLSKSHSSHAFLKPSSPKIAPLKLSPTVPAMPTLNQERQPLLDSGCHESSATSTSNEQTSESDEDDDPGEGPKKLQKSTFLIGDDDDFREVCVASVESMGNVTHAAYQKEFLSIHAIPLLFMQVTIMTCQTMIETVIPPIMQCYFKYGSKENSFTFMGIGAEELAVLAVVLMVCGVFSPSQRIAPRNMLILSAVLILLGMVGLVYTSEAIVAAGSKGVRNCPSTPESQSYFVHYLQSNFLVFMGIPIGAVMSVSLLAQLVDYQVQGMGQGLSRLSCSIGMILGPLWGGALMFQPKLLYGGAIIMVMVELIMLLSSYHALKPKD